MDIQSNIQQVKIKYTKVQIITTPYSQRHIEIYKEYKNKYNMNDYKSHKTTYNTGRVWI